MRKKSASVMSKEQLALAMVALGLLQAQTPAIAQQSASSTIYTSATVVAQCFIGDVTLSFGPVWVFGANSTNLDSVVQSYQPTQTTSGEPVSVLCTNGTPAKVYAAANTATLVGQGGPLTVDDTLTARLKLGPLAGDPDFPKDAASGIAFLGTGSIDSSSLHIYGILDVPQNAKAGVYGGTTALTIEYSP